MNVYVETPNGYTLHVLVSRNRIGDDGRLRLYTHDKRGAETVQAVYNEWVSFHVGEYLPSSRYPVSS